MLFRSSEIASEEDKGEDGCADEASGRDFAQKLAGENPHERTAKIESNTCTMRPEDRKEVPSVRRSYLPSLVENRVKCGKQLVF